MMATEKYCTLIDQLCEQLGIENPESMYETCNLEISDVGFTLSQGDEEDEDGLYVYCDLGSLTELPTAIYAQVVINVLEANLYMKGDNAPRFGFNSETGRVVMMHRLQLQELTIDGLSELLTNLIDYVPQWRAETLGTSTGN
ncbi:MAG: CesT family type III secretion system chaperone [Pseudomonadota bacterium]